MQRCARPRNPRGSSRLPSYRSRGGVAIASQNRGMTPGLTLFCGESGSSSEGSEIVFVEGSPALRSFRREGPSGARLPLTAKLWALLYFTSVLSKFFAYKCVRFNFWQRLGP